VPELSTICVCCTPRQGVRILVYTLKHWAIVFTVSSASISRHQVARVLKSPCWWALSFLLGSSQQLPELKHSILRTGRCGHGQVLVVLLYMSDILFHIQGCDPEPQLHSEGSQDFLACRGSWLHLQFSQRSGSPLPSPYTPTQFLLHWDRLSSPTSYRLLHQLPGLVVPVLLEDGIVPVHLWGHGDQAAHHVHAISYATAVPLTFDDT